MDEFIRRNIIIYLQICIICIMFTGSCGDVCRRWNNARYFNGYCYFVSNTTLTYQQAQISCNQMDKTGMMKLAEPKTDTQYLFLKEMVKSFNLSTKPTGVLLGGIRDGQTKTFIWSSGGVVENWWYSERSDNHQSKENCLEIRFVYDLKFNDVDCNRTNYYACEKYIGNPCESVLAGSEYYDGVCYKLHNEMLVWDDSSKACEQESSYLAEPRNISIVQFLILMIKSTPGQGGQNAYLLGASDKQSEGTFQWMTNGDPMTVNLWRSGEPSNLGSDGVENYLALETETMQFNDVSGNLKSKFFCQKEVNIWRHTYLAVLPRKVLLSRVQLMIASSGQDSDGFYRVMSQPGDNCRTDGTSDSGALDVSLVVEPQKSVVLHQCLGMASSGLFKQYLIIRSSLELTVILSALQTTSSSLRITASLILSTALLTQNYYLLSVPPGHGQLTVTALTEKGADIILKVPLNYRPDAVLGLTGVFLRSPGYASVTLDMYQTVVFDIRHLRAGFIYATNAVAVSYLADADVQEENLFSGYSLDMLIPVELMTTEYITFPSWPLSEQEDDYQLLALHNDTTIVIHGSQVEIIVLPLAGDVREITLPGSAFYYLKCDVPFQVRKTSTSETKGTCITTLLPSSLWQTNYVYITPSTEAMFSNTKINSAISSVLFLISEYPEFAISYPVVGSCFNIEGTNLSGCYFPIPWGVFEPVYITNNGTVFAAYTVWIKNNSTQLTCYPLGVNTSGTYWQNFDGPGNINFNDTTCNLTNVDSTSSSTMMYNTTIPSDVTSEDTATSTTDDKITSTLWTELTLTPSTGYYDWLKQIQQELQMNHRDTSAYRRSKMSIADMRISSVAIGLTGVIFLTLFCALLVFPDLFSIIRYLITQRLFQNRLGDKNNKK